MKCSTVESAKRIVNSGKKNIVIVGKNGSGKSFILNEVAKNFSRLGRPVIAVANTVYDKFDRRGSSFHFVGSRLGKIVAEHNIKRALAEESESNVSIFSRVSRVLEYVNYSPMIGLRINGFVGYDKAKEILELDPIKDDREAGWFNYFFPDFAVFGVDIKNISWITLAKEDFRGLNSQLVKLLQLEGQLKKRGILRKVEVVLRRNERDIPVGKASSGEMTLISTLLFIAARISNGTVILIDEPENSLHPAWQRDYFTRVLDLFSYYEFQTIIATHSPLIVTGAAEIVSSLHVFIAHQGRVESLPIEIGSLESLLLEVFEVSTPKNHYLSNKVRGLLNELAENRLAMHEFDEKVNSLKALGFRDDFKQKEMLDGVLELARKIDRGNN